MELEKAKRLFFEYDGSTFFMSRDGVDDDYRSFCVPAEIEKRWRDEITQRKLQAVNEPGNWRTINFLIQNADFTHTEELLEAKPAGKLWERCAFLEELLLYCDYGRKLGLSRTLAIHGVDRVIREAPLLMSRARSEEMSGRINALLKNARRTAVQLRRRVKRMDAGSNSRQSHRGQ